MFSLRFGKSLARAALLAAVLSTWLGDTVSAQEVQKTPARVRVWQDTLTIPTSVEGLPDPNPPFDLFRQGRFYNYPYTLRHNLIDKRVSRAWRALFVENEFLKCTILPDLGGHLYTCIDKISGTSVFYANPSIKFARIAYRGMWAALGVEFNFPVSHNWMTVSPVDFAYSSESDGSVSVWVGNTDRAYGMTWRVQLTLRPGRAVLGQKTTLYNPSETRHRYYWWTNAGVRVWDDSLVLYPMRFTANHGFADIDTWPVNSDGVDLSVVGNQKFGPVSRFSYGSREPYMAVYHPRTKSGVVHFSSPLDLPAKKIWSWSSDEDGLDWRTALSDDNSAYVEIQAGLFRDQETYGFLGPQESRSFSEIWIPIRDLGGVSRANPDAVLNLSRHSAGDNSIALDVALNVTRSLPNAAINILDGSRTVASIRASLSPRETFKKIFPGLASGPVYTFTLHDASGQLLLSHTEGKYDFISGDKVRLGKQPAHGYAPAENLAADGLLELGAEQERNGELLMALQTYQSGLAHFPESIALHRAAGRLEVSLKQYRAATEHLAKALSSDSSDHETAYYLGLALAAEGDNRAARTNWEFAQQSQRYRAPALLALAALESRQGNRPEALRLIKDILKDEPSLSAAGNKEIALLRTLGRTEEAKHRLAFWRNLDPTNLFLRWESVNLGQADRGLMAHLAADSDRVLGITGEYMHLGLFQNAIDTVSQTYPSGPEVISEPGMPHPNSNPLLAYYRGFCRYAIGKDGRADFDAASRMPTTYIFPNRADSLLVLQKAVETNPQDATASFLLGSLYLSGGMTAEALQSWESARHIRPSIPTLHRNMGYALLRSGASPERAIELFREGLKYDPRNVDVYLGLEEAMAKSRRPAQERALALEAYPDLPGAPASLVLRLIQLQSEAGEFDAAEKQLATHFFPREEGGANVREVYIALRLTRAKTVAAQGDCTAAKNIVDHLADANPALPFTSKGLNPFIQSESSKQEIAGIRSACTASSR